MKNYIKHLIWAFLGLALAVSSCKKDDTIPKPLIENSKTAFEIYTDESVSIEPKVTSEGESTYKWVEDEKEISKEPILVYTSKEVKEHTISLTVINDGGESKIDYTVNVKAIPLPTVEIPNKDGKVNAKIHSETTITPTIKSIRNVTYKWVLNEETLSTEKILKYTFKKEGTFNLKLIATNASGSTEKVIKVETSNYFANGVFVLNEGNMTSESGFVNFIYPNGSRIDYAYKNANSGTQLGNVIQDMWLANGKAYFVAQNGPEQITVANAQTLVKEKSYTKDGKLSWPTHIVVASNSRAYVRDNSGLHAVDISGEITPHKEVICKANKQIMDCIKGKVYVGGENIINIINPETDKVIKTIELDAKITSGIKEGKDQCIWVSTNNNSLYKINTTTDAIIKKYSIPTEFSMKAGFIPSNGLCASKQEDIVYWKSSSWGKAYLYKFDASTEKAELFIDFKKEYTDSNITYGEVAVHPVTGNIYIDLIKGYGADYLINFLYVIAPDKTLVQTHKNCTHFHTSCYFTEDFK